MSEQLPENPFAKLPPPIDIEHALSQFDAVHEAAGRLAVGNARLETLNARNYPETLHSIHLEMIALNQDEPYNKAVSLGKNSPYEDLLPMHGEVSEAVSKGQAIKAEQDQKLFGRIEQVDKELRKASPENGRHHDRLKEDKTAKVLAEHPEYARLSTDLQKAEDQLSGLEDVIEIAGQPWPYPYALKARDRDRDGYISKNLSKGSRDLPSRYRNLRRQAAAEYRANTQPTRADLASLIIMFNLGRNMTYDELAYELYFGDGKLSAADQRKRVEKMLEEGSKARQEIQEELANHGLVLYTGQSNLYKADGQLKKGLVRSDQIILCQPVEAAAPQPTSRRGILNGKPFYRDLEWQRPALRAVIKPKTEKRPSRLELPDAEEVDWRESFTAQVDRALELLKEHGLVSREEMSPHTGIKNVSSKIGTETSRQFQIDAGLISSDRKDSKKWTTKEMLLAMIYNTNRRKLSKNAPDKQAKKEALEIIDKQIEALLEDIESKKDVES